MSKTPKKVYAWSRNATSSSGLCKSVGDFSHLKNLFGKANHALLLAAEEIYGSSLQSALYLYLRCRPCKRRLKNFIPFKTLLSESQRSLERVKRFIGESLSALRSLNAYKATHDSVTRVSRGTRRGLDFELREPNKSKSGCNVWQILWLIIVWPWELPHGNEYEHIFFCRRVLLSHFQSRGPKR